MRKIDAAFFDVDQTLFDGKTGTVAPSAIEAITKAQANGTKVFIATGRCYKAFVDTGINKILKWDGYVTSNGAATEDADGNLIDALCFTDQQVSELMRVCKENHMGLLLQDDYKNFEVFNPDHRVDDAFTFFHLPVPAHKDYENERICMATVYQAQGFDYSVIDQIEGLMSIPGKAPYADVVLKGVSKASGLDMIRKHFHFENDFIAFGDGDNDLEMLEKAEIGVAMGNGTEKVKENADYVTDDLHHDGIYNALKHFGCF